MAPEMKTARHFVDRQREVSLFLNMLQESTPHRILGIIEGGKRGKSYLLWHFQDYCKDQNIPVALIDFDPNRSGLSTYLQVVKHICDALDLAGFERVQACYDDYYRSRSFIHVETGNGEAGIEFGESIHFRKSSLKNLVGRDHIYVDVRGAKFQEQVTASHRQEKLQYDLGVALLEDLGEFCMRNQPVVILIDTLESVPGDTWQWLDRWILRYIADKCRGVRIILAGRNESLKYLDVRRVWSDYLYLLKEFAEFTRSDIKQYLLSRGVAPTDTEISIYHRLVAQNPMLMSNIGDALVEAGYGPRYSSTSVGSALQRAFRQRSQRSSS